MLTKLEWDDWFYRVKRILTGIQIPWELHLYQDKIFTDTNGNGRLYLQIQFDAVDNLTGSEDYRSYCRKWYLSPHMTTQEIVRTAWLAYQGAVLHEASEQFKYKGEMIFGPHIDPEALVEVADRREVR